MQDKIETTCPVVRRERGKYVRLVDIEGLKRKRTPCRFEYDVEYVRESETILVVTNAQGRTVKMLSTYVDWYGYLTSPEEYLSSAPAVADEYGALDGPLVVEVLTTVWDRPLIPSGEPCLGAAYGRRSYLAVPDDWWADDEMTAVHLAAKDLEESYENRPTSPHDDEKTHVVWTTKDGRDQDARTRRFRAFLDEALVGMPDEVAEKVRDYDWVKATLRQTAEV